MKKKLVSIGLIAALLLALLSVTAFAAAPDRGDVYNHVDVKIDSLFNVTLGDKTYTLLGAVDWSHLRVEVRGENNFSTDGLTFLARNEWTHNEYTAYVDGVMKSLKASDIDWIGNTYRMSNVYVTARIYLGSYIPEVLKDHLPYVAIENVPQDVRDALQLGEEARVYYVDLVDYQYQGIQECTDGGDMRSQRFDQYVEVPTGLDLYITASQIIEVILPETTDITGTKVWDDEDDKDGNDY